MSGSKTSKQKEAFLEALVTLVNVDIYAITDRCIELAKGDSGRNKFYQIEKEIYLKTLNMGRKILQAVLDDFRLDYKGNFIPCRCGNEMKFVDRRTKNIYTIFGKIKVQRAYYYCSGCGKGYFPLDKKFGISKSNFSPFLKEIIENLAVELPFAICAKLIRDIFNINLTKRQIQLLSEEAGRKIEEKIQGRIKRLENDGEQEKVHAGGETIERLYLSADGTTVFVDKRWKEVKIGAIFEGTVPKNIEEQPLRKSVKYLGTFESSEKFGKRWYLFAMDKLKNAKEVIIIADGSKWIWKEANKYFPMARIEIIDWFHVEEKIGDLGVILFGEERSKTRKEWIEEILDSLKGDEIGAVIEKLEKMRPISKKKSLAIKEVLTYLENNKQRMKYKSLKEGGYFIGSGTIEAACKTVVGARFKRSGMQWSRNGAQSPLQLRIDKINRKSV
jgi:hypothetical protein